MLGPQSVWDEGSKRGLSIVLKRYREDDSQVGQVGPLDSVRQRERRWRPSGTWESRRP